VPSPPPPAELVRELEVLVHAQHPLLAVETVEEQRAQTVFSYVADRVGLPMFVWNPTNGLAMQGPEGGRPVGTEKPAQCLAFIEQADLEAIFFLPGFDDFEGVAIHARVKEIYRKYFKHRGQVVITAPSVVLPPDLEPLFTPVDMPLPSRDAYHRFVSELLTEISKRRPIQVDLTNADVGELLRALHGLSVFEVEKIITRAVIEEGRLDPAGLKTVLSA